MDIQARLRSYVIVCLLLLKVSINEAWLLSHAGLNDSSYSVRHLSAHFSRVFLCITVKNNVFPTLIETHWPLSQLPMHSAIFPNSEVHANTGDDNGDADCTRLQQAHWSQVDSLSRLWVMDAGSLADGCTPKLLVFDLMRNNAELLRIDCSQHIDVNATQNLVVQLGPKPSSCEQERHIFFILDNKPTILAYDILEQTWHKRDLMCNKYDNMLQAFPIKPIDLTFTAHGELLISDQDGSLYSSTEALQFIGSTQTQFSHATNGLPLQLKRLGSLLGPSRSMVTDINGALFYAVPKFGAVVRCGQLSNLTAEGNEIIYLTSKNIQQIFLGAQFEVWVLSDRVLKAQDICYPGI